MVKEFGILTLLGQIVQDVLKSYLEPLEPCFHDHMGMCKGEIAQHSVEKATPNALFNNNGLNIKVFLTIDHDLTTDDSEACKEIWVCMLRDG